jgi:hypothetical protein
MSELRYLLWSYKHDMWWRPGGWGYTWDREHAGLFTQEQAVREVVKSADAGRLDEATVMIVAGPSTEQPDETQQALDEVERLHGELAAVTHG